MQGKMSHFPNHFYDTKFVNSEKARLQWLAEWPHGQAEKPKKLPATKVKKDLITSPKEML